MHPRQDWTKKELLELIEQPFMALVFQAQQMHQRYFDPTQIQISTLLSIKTGRCPEDCAYCPQSAHYSTNLEPEKLMDLDKVLAYAKAAKAKGATRFCMGAAWRNLPKKALPKVIELIKAVNALGLESCVTFGMLDKAQAESLKAAGLDYYNHNLDTSPEYYKEIITTRTYADRLNTLETVRQAGLKVCCGGILGMGETRDDRLDMLLQLATQPQHPESVPINQLIPIPGTPLATKEKIDSFEFIKTIALARIIMPKAMIRLSAGRENMNQEMQALCFFAGVNSIFFGETLLTAPNPKETKDLEMFKTLGLNFMTNEKTQCCPA